MINWAINARPIQLASAALVVVIGLALGRQAALGMGPAQWMAGVVAVAAAVSLAVLTHTPSGEATERS